jgi:hypothetical protein
MAKAIDRKMRDPARIGHDGGEHAVHRRNRKPQIHDDAEAVESTSPTRP